MRSGWGQWLVVVGLALVLAGSYLAWRSVRGGPLPPGEMPSVTEFRDEAPLPAFTLRGPRGEFSNVNLLGRWSFMFFGYTQCPDICPTALNLMKEVKAAVTGPRSGIPGTQSEPAPTFQVVFVSVDPRRDSHELLEPYLAAFDPGFVGISGDDAALAPLSKNLGVFYQRNDGGQTRHYTVDHSAAIYLIDPRGRLAAVFSPPQNAYQLASAYQRITRQPPLATIPAVTP